MPQSEPLEIDAVALNALLASEDPPAILDVREPWEVEICALKGVIAISLTALPQRVAEIPRDRPLAVMCHHGGRSAQATMWLRQHGFARAMNVAGGIDAWSRLVDPGVPRY